ncbi:acyltransferase family protein [Roseomonas sp. E05]|uniref:acyltransferase family protein n=1 Tax=Roseomonas sp. E05 TaxID=3046310 RepID=UPI0024B9A695|nr:acyltransferase family protein [Roseomonas sp. E05]MDJ0391464.1 acyltransferase family protein [Roseomonas sp. E05]
MTNTALRREDLPLELMPDAAPGSESLEAAAAGNTAQAGWRADIDGLRALAVLPVVIFHIAQSFLRGGYVGVDIFFVISGYLISRNVFQRLDRGTFSLGSFYEHRLRRIFPAYSLVLLATLGMSLAHDLPAESRGFGVALLAALGSVSNIYFWATTDYFSVLTESQALLHTWSLSVEEQFYLFFPLLALLLYRRGGAGFRGVLLAIFLASLALSIPAAYLYPLTAFYSLATRAWELLLGSFLAFGMLPAPRRPLTRNLATAAGLVLILASMALLTPLSPFPGLAALPPCLGAALIILGGETGGSVVARLLSWRPIAFIGLVSYSLYLWHWPVMVAYRAGLIFAETDSKLLARGGVFALSFVLAVLSWWAVERTTRDRRRVPTRLLLAGSATMAGLLATMGLVLAGSGGLPGRFSPQAAAVASYLAYDPAIPYRQGRCFLERTDRFADFDRPGCLPDLSGRPSYLLLGDSHAAHLYPGLRAAFPEANILQATGVLCPATAVLQPVVSLACPQLVEMAVNQLPGERRITKVWLSSAWSGGLAAGSPGWSPHWLEDLGRTVEMFRAKGIEAVIIGPGPEYAGGLPRLLAIGIERRDPAYAEAARREDALRIDRSLAAFAAEKGFAYVSLLGALCGGGACPAYAAPGVPLIFDASHFTEAGSVLAVSKIAGALR